MKFTYLAQANANYIQDLLDQYQRNPASVDESWQYFFEGLEIGGEPSANGTTVAPPDIPTTNGAGPSHRVVSIDLSSEAKVAELINAYRDKGYLIANTNPLADPMKTHPLLDLSNFQLSEKDLSRTFTAGKLLGMGPAALTDIIRRLRRTYCSSVGVEYTHIQNPDIREWMREKLERNPLTTPTETKKRILRRLTASNTFEQFLHTRYVAQKRFSIEGGESLIPCLDSLIETAAGLGADNIVMGMAHRGRLNVLRNIYGKKPEHILTEFEQEYEQDSSMGQGDVKYHMGFSADVVAANGKSVHLSLQHNPSHLEFVNPVVEGVARAKQRALDDPTRIRVIPVLIHGDAAFAGQGVVYETLNLSQVRGYTTGGTIHIVIDNQIGFTTDNTDARSTEHSTDLAKLLEVPIFHVNGDDPEAVWQITQISTEFRQKFGQDVFIDLICYRRYGHNEGDEPLFTQPVLYKKIKSHPTPRTIYAKRLEEEGVVQKGEADQMVKAVVQEMTEAQKITRSQKPQPFRSSYKGSWAKLHRATENEILAPVDTAVPEKTLRALAAKLYELPATFKPNTKLARLVEQRKRAIEDGQGIDWGGGETLAYATLLTEGYPIRISGQDVERGTFSHRHAVLNHAEDGTKYAALQHLSPDQAEFLIFNSILSETAVLGFEYGWSLADPDALVIWEAQFGDFANGAQVIIDQFIASGESKWNRASGIVLLLPHGYEGQGPEHSSARLERFLQLGGELNMTVANFTTPAQLFHALRRQLKRSFRKPMVVMTPKSLLRHPQAVSTLKDFSGSFQEVLDDPLFTGAKAKAAKRVVLCTGKIYYDLLAEREKKKIKNTALIRIEQIYPWPGPMLEKILAKYSGARFIWCQEEPRNMGAWFFILSAWVEGERPMHVRLKKNGVRNPEIQYVGRDAGAAPAVGSHKLHLRQQNNILAKALKDSK